MQGELPPFGLKIAPPRDEPRAGGRRRPARAGQDLFWIALAGSIAGFVLLVLKPNRNQVMEAHAEIRLLRAEMAALEARTEELRRWERALASDDPQAWEAVARERLGWLRPGERTIELGGASQSGRIVSGRTGRTARYSTGEGGCRD